MIPEWLTDWLGPILGGLSLFLVKRAVGQNDKRSDMIDDRFKGLEQKVTAIELNMAGDLATKEDIGAVYARLDKLSSDLSSAREMLMRIDERSMHRG